MKVERGLGGREGWSLPSESQSMRPLLSINLSCLPEEALFHQGLNLGLMSEGHRLHLFAFLALLLWRCLQFLLPIGELSNECSGQLTSLDTAPSFSKAFKLSSLCCISIILKVI